jgi:hypothetical protein
MQFLLSRDCGLTYAPIKAETSAEIARLAKQYDDDMLRWVIVDEENNDEVVRYCLIHTKQYETVRRAGTIMITNDRYMIRLCSSAWDGLYKGRKENKDAKRPT